MRKTILIITLGLLLLLSSCDNTTASGGVSLPDWMYSTEARTVAELSEAIASAAAEENTGKEVIVSIPSGTTIEAEELIEVSGKVKLIIKDKAEITSTDTIFDVTSGSIMTIEGNGTLDAGSQPVIENAGALTITGGSYTTTGSVAISGSGSVTVPESSTASFAVASTGSVFSSSSDLSIKGGTYNVDNKDFIALCAVGYMPQEIADSDPARYEVGWSDAKIVADIINGLSQENFQTDIKTIIDAVSGALAEGNTPAGEGGTGTGENGGEGSTRLGIGTGTASDLTRVAAADNTLTITGGTNGTPYTLTFDDYTHGFKDPKFATVVSGTATLDITIPTTTTTIPSTLDYAITCTDVTVEIDGHTVVINLSKSTGKVEISQSGADFQLLIKYPTVGENALKVKSDNRAESTVDWTVIIDEELLDPQSSASTGSGSTGN